ncbi:MAG: hypothetical protein V1779_16145 [bacterium]
MKAKIEKDNLQIVQDFLIDEMGNYVESLSGRVLLGRIWGLLLTSPGPVSLKEMAKKLNVSKPAVSSTINMGIQYGVFRKQYNADFPRENFMQLRYNSMEMLINPGNRKLQLLYEKFSESVKLIEEMGNKREKDEELKQIYNRMKYLTECFKIFLDEYEKMSKIVVDKIKDLGKKYEIEGDLK